MRPCGCEFCTDLRNIQPAKYLDGGDEEFQKRIKEARKHKKFILELSDKFVIVDECPKCGYNKNMISIDNFH